MSFIRFFFWRIFEQPRVGDRYRHMDASPWASGVVVQSIQDGWVRFDVTGAVVDMMERLCPLPVRRMTAGQATRSIVEHIGCLVIRLDAGFALMAPRSYAASLLHALRAAAVAVG